ncbi:uncharacterized protein LOC133791968 [Humulus lupulus]|uniref:uncharacterized protein LOC133791968 n=1 Tax=Humulus lupulus TaxID=3486 RepID=UPI002B4065AB|nr:uncharacterized protein LOC133791968 [Humulus lupulus]
MSELPDAPVLPINPTLPREGQSVVLEERMGMNFNTFQKIDYSPQGNSKLGYFFSSKLLGGSANSECKHGGKKFKNKYSVDSTPTGHLKANIDAATCAKVVVRDDNGRIVAGFAIPMRGSYSSLIIEAQALVYPSLPLRSIPISDVLHICPADLQTLPSLSQWKINT